jgi:hypothetical protein
MTNEKLAEKIREIAKVAYELVGLALEAITLLQLDLDE